MDRRWEQYYADAMLETDDGKLLSRIDVAMSVLTESLQELGPSPQDVRDKKAILDGLRTLRLLRKELEVATDEQDMASEQERAG